MPVCKQGYTRENPRQTPDPDESARKAAPEPRIDPDLLKVASLSIGFLLGALNEDKP